MIKELANGERVVLKVLEPPLGDYRDKVGCWQDLRDDLLGGDLQQWLVAPYFVAEIAGEVVGSMCYYTGVGRPEVGLVEFVQTAEQHRRKGIAAMLMAELVQHFNRCGGWALYLCTVNPHAGDLYEKNGFCYWVGDGMRYLAPTAGDYDREYLAYGGEARVRAASWGDLPAAAALFNHRQPDWGIKEYLTRCFGDTRFERHFVELMRRTEEARGEVLVLENPLGRVVGLVGFERLDSFYEQHVAYLSFRASPAYFGQVPELLETARERAGALGISILQTYVAADDNEAAELLRGADFVEEARLRGRLSDGEYTRDMLVYTSLIEHAAGRRHSRDDYYGQRRAWQAEKVQR